VKRKFEYLIKRFGGDSFCVGCGRCGRQCTAGIDIFDIVNDLVHNAEAVS
ncbi:MAG: sulfite reductase, partial [Alphaproteobacteria bacterium]|nr:sulfite reductase [Alphaproteobacteria bacterium]